MDIQFSSTAAIIQQLGAGHMHPQHKSQCNTINEETEVEVIVHVKEHQSCH